MKANSIEFLKTLSKTGTTDKNGEALKNIYSSFKNLQKTMLYLMYKRALPIKNKRYIQNLSKKPVIILESIKFSSNKPFKT